MPDKEELETLKVKSLEMEDKLLKFQKEQADIKRRISLLEGKESIEPNPGQKETPVGGVVLIILGALLTLTVIGAIIGIPLLIWGIIIVNRPGTKTTPEKQVQKTEKPAAKTEEQKPNKEEKKTPKPRASFEEDVGIKWFARIGILALVIGVGFFIKYAIDMDWINHLTRIIMGVVFGISLIVLGEFVSKKKKYHYWGKTLVGGGFAISYFVIYAAYHFEEYRQAIGIGQGLEIFLLSIVAICAILFALKDNSQIIAAESFFLGYITSLLSNNFELITLIYGLFLTIALVTVVSYKKWAIIGTGGVFASYIMYLVWDISNANSFFYSTFILCSYFLAFNVQSFFLRTKKELNILNTVANSGLFFLLYYQSIYINFNEFTGLFTLALALLYFAGYYIYRSLNDENFASTHLYLALLFLTITVPVQLNSEWVTMVWALETLLLTILSLRTRITALRLSSYVVAGITTFKTLIFDIHLQALDTAYLINSTRLFSFMVTIFAFYSIYTVLKNKKENLTENERIIPSIYSWIAFFFLTIIIFVEFAENYSVWVTITLAALSIAYLSLSRINKRTIFYQSIATSVILFLKVIFIDTWYLESFNANYILASTRIIAFVGSIISFYVIYSTLRHYRESLKQGENLLPIIYSCAASLLLIIITFLEFDGSNSVWATITLAVLVLAYLYLSKVKIKELFYQSIVISGILFIKVLMYDSLELNEFNSNELLKSTRLIAYAAGIITFYLIAQYMNLRKDELPSPNLPQIFAHLGTFLSFVLIIIEMQNYWISVGWSILALIVMIAGFATSKKYLRMQGLLIFTITILKVFIYDTRNLETIFRTVSYIVLGAILLLVSLIYSKYKDKLKEIL